MLRVVSAHTWHFPSILAQPPVTIHCCCCCSADGGCRAWQPANILLAVVGSRRTTHRERARSIGNRIRRRDFQWLFRVSRVGRLWICQGIEWPHNKESNQKEWNRRSTSALSSSKSSAECVVPSSPKIAVDLTLPAICQVFSERVFALIKPYNEVINSTNNDIDFFWLLCHWIIRPAITSSHHRPRIAALRLC